MILVRVEPISSGKFPMSVEEKRNAFLHHISEQRKERLGNKFDSQDMGNVMGCWFAPAYAKTGDELDVLEYANDIIRVDHEGSDIRLIAIEIPDDEIDKYRVKNMPEGSFARQRSRNEDSEYVIPTDIIIKNARIIMTLRHDEVLESHLYRACLSQFENDLTSHAELKSSRQLREALRTSR